MTALHQSREIANLVAERLRLYAQPQRLMILSFLLDGEQNVGAIEAATGVAQPALSQQLAELRHAGQLTSRRAAKQVFYRLRDAEVEGRVRAITKFFASESNGSGTDAPESFRAAVPPVAPQLEDHAGAATFAQILR